ncbi:MAG: hypothetical protein MUE70_11495 [Desulfobacterales bacterium]|nr:hypothetical protein [Desulfobacterales bacterium]
MSVAARLDHYLAEIKINTKLPLPLCPCSIDDILGPVGNRLHSSGIRFFAMDRSFYKSPFEYKAIQSVQFAASGCKFFDEERKMIEIESSEDTCLHEGEYRTNVKENLMPSSDRDLISDGKEKKNRRITGPIESFRVLFLYLRNNSVPLKMTDITMNYSFLGCEKHYCAFMNFKTLIDKIESVYQRQFNHDMVRYAHTLPQTTDKVEISAASASNRKKNAMQLKFSNVDAVDLMSRLMYGQWIIENGWADRVVKC